jgi:hypothetical protein
MRAGIESRLNARGPEVTEVPEAVGRGRDLAIAVEFALEPVESNTESCGVIAVGLVVGLTVYRSCE